MELSPRDFERFWSKVKLGPDCWTWTSTIWGRGYGEFWLQGRHRNAHRVAFEIAFGPIPDGMLVCHRCDNPQCVRPAHLFLGTQSDNIQDAIAKGRYNSEPPHGEANPQSKLTYADAQAIRTLRTEGRTYSSLARQFNVSTSAIWQVLRGRNWKEAAWPQSRDG